MKKYKIVKYDDDFYPGWKGSISDKGLINIFVDSRINPIHPYTVFGKTFNDIADAIKEAETIFDIRKEKSRKRKKQKDLHIQRF